MTLTRNFYTINFGLHFKSVFQVGKRVKKRTGEVKCSLRLNFDLLKSWPCKVGRKLKYVLFANLCLILYVERLWSGPMNTTRWWSGKWLSVIFSPSRKEASAGEMSWIRFYTRKANPKNSGKRSERRRRLVVLLWGKRRLPPSLRPRLVTRVRTKVCMNKNSTLRLHETGGTGRIFERLSP